MCIYKRKKKNKKSKKTKNKVLIIVRSISVKNKKKKKHFSLKNKRKKIKIKFKKKNIKKINVYHNKEVIIKMIQVKLNKTTKQNINQFVKKQNNLLRPSKKS